MTDQQSRNEIRSRPCPDCCLCGTPGRPLYSGLRDRLFGAPGEWNLKKCPNPDCRLVWLDPIPLEEDIGQAYRNYYTHRPGDADIESSEALHKMLNLARSILRGIYKVSVRATPIYYERKKLFLMYLDKTKPGRLLDVGCGDGQRLVQFRKLGWEVEGQEVDPKSAEYASSTHGIPVHLGFLEDLRFPDAAFDAITMNHVIEHVHDPVALLAECRRVLRPGGALVAVTPNVESYEHKHFGSHWRGLEPPRHLHVFSQRSLRKVASKAGFGKRDTWTTAANTQIFAMGSLALRRYSYYQTGKRQNGLSRHALAVGHQLWTSAVNLRNKDSGEECVLKATK